MHIGMAHLALALAAMAALGASARADCSRDLLAVERRLARDPTQADAKAANAYLAKARQLREMDELSCLHQVMLARQALATIPKPPPPSGPRVRPLDRTIEPVRPLYQDDETIDRGRR